MRDGIHPNWFPEAKVTCSSCGTTWTVGSTRPTITLDICSHCHPFYTGEQRIVDTEGQVDRFMKRLEARDTRMVEQTPTSRTAPDLPIGELGLGRQYAELLANNGVATAGDFIKKLEEGGDEAILSIRGIGRKILTDAKKALRTRGYELPTTQQA
jgi:large subunit ribosomal protein L31